MKKSVLITLISIFLLSFKEKPVKVDPAVLGSYYFSDSSQTKSWTLKQSADGENKIDFYKGNDKETLFTVVMKDPIHFKTPHEYSQTIPGQATKFLSAKGQFLEAGKMELAVSNSDISAGLKLTFSMEGAEKIIYKKR
jgi:hypothetical protein